MTPQEFLARYLVGEHNGNPIASHARRLETKGSKEQLTALAETLSGEGRRVSPMQVAARLLKESVSQYAEGK